jgi:PAS domain S-box-containing protein
MTIPPSTGSPLTDLLFDRAGVGLCLVAADGTVLRANAEWLRSTGLTTEQVIGSNIIELFPATRDTALAMHARARAGHYVEVPRHAQRVNGRETWWEGSVSPVPMEGGMGLLITAREVTSGAQREAWGFRSVTGRESADEEALHRHELVVQQSRDIILFMRHEDGRILEANPAATVAYGYTRDELLDLTIHDLRAPETRALTASQMAEADVRGVLFESVHQRQDGSTFPVEVSSRGVTVNGTHMLISVVRDITERKRAEEALRESEERLRAAFAASPDAININRVVDGAYVAVNERFEELSLWPRAEVMGKTIVDLNVWVDMEERDRLLTRLLTSGSVQNAEVAFRRKDGSVFAASISGQLFEAKGERFLLAVTRDISAMKRAEQTLRDADRNKNEFLGMLSHELRNPLAPIRNSLYVLDHVDPTSQQAQRAKEVANRQIAHLTRLVDDLLDVTRIARGKFGLRRTLLDLGALARRTAEDHRALIEERQVALALEVQDQPVVVKGDETRLAEVLGNLLHNAAKFTHVGGRVTLTVAEEQGKAVIHVSDTGSGIAPEVLPTIFEPFTQAKQTLARSEGGLGLGLALVKGLVEMHGGSVSAASDGLGKGATFTITLPLSVMAAQVIPARPGRGGTAAPRRVLVIEDNHDAANILREVLELDNHVVEVAYSGRDGIEKARAFHPDVALCDIGLPEMDGYEVARTMRADPELRRIALIALSGYVQPEDVAMAKEAGFDAHIAKPSSFDTIERALAEVGREGATALDLRGQAGA